MPLFVLVVDEPIIPLNSKTYGIRGCPLCGGRSLPWPLIRSLLAAWMFLGAVLPSFATRPAANYNFKLWQTQDGLPENTVQAFAQTKDGFLWVGTTGGLTRFDGDGFDVFDHTNTKALAESSILSLLVSHDGDLWVGTDGGGLVRYHKGRFDRFGARNGFEHAFVRTLFEDSRGVIWIGTDSGLFRLDTGGEEALEQVSDVTKLSVRAMGEDSDGRIWIGGDRLFVIEHGETREQRLPWFKENQVTSIRGTKDGTVWLGTLGGLWRLQLHEHAFARVNGIHSAVRQAREFFPHMEKK